LNQEKYAVLSKVYESVKILGDDSAKYGTTRPRPQLSLVDSPEGSTYAVRYSS